MYCLFFVFVLFVFFFQAEDGIRDIGVTGVQTCALPIYCPVQGESKTLICLTLWKPWATWLVNGLAFSTITI